jgi:hypothetical protein
MGEVATARRRGFASVAAALGVAVVLAACGGGGSGPGPSGPSIGPEHSPVAVGDRWVYRSWTGDSDAEAQVQLVKAVGTQTVAGRLAVVQEWFDADDGRRLGALYLDVGPQGVTQLADPAVPGDVSLELLRFPMAAGSSYTQFERSFDVGADLDGDGRNETLLTRSVVTGIGFESVQTDVATFARAFRAQTAVTETGVYSSGRPSILLTQTTIDDWYVEGIGLVREDAVAREGSAVLGSSHVRLVGYAVGPRRSDSVSPVATLVAPDPAGANGPFSRIELRFDEPMDVSTIDPGNVDLRDAAGTPVPLQAVRNGPIWLFIPTGPPLPGGRYQLATGVGATDLLGNPLAPASWVFDIDATRPSVVSTTPTAGADNLPLDSVITIDFSEDIDPVSVVSGGVSVLAVGATQPTSVAVTAHVQGPRITLTPTAPLPERTFIDVQVNPTVRDTAGNELGTGFVSRFRTDRGLFDYPALTDLGDARPQAVAVGDVTGDGRADVVLTTWFAGDPALDYRLFVFAQQPGGTLGAPVLYATQANFGCMPTSIQVADLDGDGRRDVVIGESGCGFEIFRQQGDGTLSSTGVLASTESHRVRAVDLDGDGRLDLVGVGWGSNQVEIRLRTAGGSYAAPLTYALNHAGAEDLEIGDVNGDGRPDVVVASGEAMTGGALSILFQRPDGSFGDPAYPAGVAERLGAVAVGDVNGDGRDDIVAADGLGGMISVLLQEGSGQLGPIQRLPSLYSVVAIDVVDVDGDGRRDVLSHNGETFGINLQLPDGSLAAMRPYDALAAGDVSAESIATGDVNGDGRIDLVTTGVAVLLARTPAANPSVPKAHPLGAPGGLRAGSAAASSAARWPARR